ncbi:MAG: IS256 family transposase [Candidatus Thorarchaeota archaeon]|jgi:transposase-like protein
MDFTDKEMLRKFIKDNDIRDIAQLNMVMRKMMGGMIEELLEVERDEHLGYAKHDTASKETDNSRNGYSPKTVRSSHGDLDLKIPRDRKSEFEPRIVEKRQTDISEIEDRVIAMYAKGMTVRDIQSYLLDIYGAEISTQTISNMTDQVLPLVEEWRSRPLELIYAILYMDGIRYKVRGNGQIQDKTVYGIIGIGLDGIKHVLGLWIAEKENAKCWLQVLTEVRNRGVSDVLIVTSDGLPGIEDAIAAVYPEAEYQGCVLHVIRNSLKYVSHQDKQEFSRDIKPIYQAPTEEAALAALDELKEKWSEEYSLSVSVWERNWDRIRTMFRFTAEIRRLIYTTNAIESFHSQLRKVTKNRSLFPTDTSLLKLLYLVTQNTVKKWTMKIPHWNKILAQLSIHFGERVHQYL